MHENIVDIQNSFWKAYKDFYKSKDMSKYNMKIMDIAMKYKDVPPMLEFCQSLVMAWAPVINKMMEVNDEEGH